MRYVVTGGTGFIGRQIVQELARAGYTVKVATRVPERVFFGFVNWSLVLTGAKLLYDALIG